MTVDIVIPDGNEAEFLEMASLLGFDSLYFAYSVKDYKKGVDRVSKLNSNIKVKCCVIGDNKIAGKFRNTFCITDCSFVNNGVIRKIFENKGINLVYGLELNRLNDHTHFLNSGLDQVLCKLAKKHGTIICFNFHDLLFSDNKARLLGRIMQNIRFCKKYKVKIAIASFATKPIEMRYYHDLVSLLVVLKADKNSLSIF